MHLCLLYAAFISCIYALVALRPYQLSAYCSYPGLSRLMSSCYLLICAGLIISFLTILFTVIYIVTIIICLATWIIT